MFDWNYYVNLYLVYKSLDCYYFKVVFDFFWGYNNIMMFGWKKGKIGVLFIFRINEECFFNLIFIELDYFLK